MKKKGFISSVAIAGMLSLIVSAAFTDDFKYSGTVKQDDSGVAVYDYSNFGAVGSFTSVTDPANSSVTHIYANMRISGHYGSGDLGGTVGSGAWNATNVTWFNANGTVAKTFDSVANVTDYYSVNGKLIKEEVVLEGAGLTKQTYTATPTYDSTGGYTLVRQGLFKDPTKTDVASSYVDVKSKVYVDANGKTQWEENYGRDENNNKTTSKSTYQYDAAGNLEYKETRDQDNRVTNTLYYKFGRPDHGTTTDYNPDGQTTVSEPTKTSVTYNYSGNRLVSTTSYDKLGKLSDTTAFDAFGRVSRVSDAMGRTTGEYQYNDSGTDVTKTLGSYSVTVKPGGCSLFIQTTYDTTTGASKVDNTIFVNGNTNTPMASKTVSGSTSSVGTGTTAPAAATTSPAVATTSPASTTSVDKVKLLATEQAQTTTVNLLSKSLNKAAGDVDIARKANASNLSTLITLRDTLQKDYNKELETLLSQRKQLTDLGVNF